jgi:hypothetical protein
LKEISLFPCPHSTRNNVRVATQAPRGKYIFFAVKMRPH